jgi:hypothetical protein
MRTIGVLTEMKKLLVSLTVAESKRLIAKGLLALDEVQTAMQEGYLCITLGTTSSYLVEEILGTYDKTRHVAGLSVKEGISILAKDRRTFDAIFHKGEYIDNKKVVDIIHELGPDDVIIKSANALDRDMVPLVLLASSTGGTVGSFIGGVASKNITLIMPVGLEKCIPVSYDEIAGRFGMDDWDYSIGMPVGIIAVPEGVPFTEIEALEALFGVEAMPIAAGGVNGAEGAVTLFVEGDDEDIDDAYNYLKELKGEPPFPIIEGVVQDFW